MKRSSKLLAAAALTGAVVAGPAHRPAPAAELANVTFYGPGVCWDAACTTRSGLSAHAHYPETAACGWRFQMGEVLYLVELDRQVWCIDTGLLDQHGVDVDVFEYGPAPGRFDLTVERRGWRPWR